MNLQTSGYSTSGDARRPAALPFPRPRRPGEDWLGLEDFLRNAVPGGETDLAWLQPMVRRSFVAEKGVFYNEDLRAGEDFLYYCELLAKGARFYLTRRSYYFADRRSGSLSYAKDRRRLHSDLVRSYRLARAILADHADRGAVRLLDRRGRVLEASLAFAEMGRHLREGQRRALVAASFKLASNPAAYTKFGRVCRRAMLRFVAALVS